jgi:DNA-binding NarL/FixJ family response regulator
MEETVPTRRMGAEWPLVGRVEELDFLRQIRSSIPAGSAVISGPAGVGKSRLARASLSEAAEEGWATLTLRGSAGFAAVPLGPLRTVLRIPGSENLGDLASAVERELVARQSDKGLLVLVDDGQDLDESSVGLLHQLVAAGSIALIVTVRSGSRLLPALTTLWTDRLAERIELQNLSLRETGDLLAESLGGTVQDSSANRIWQVTAGNPLSLREVILSSVEGDALNEVDGEWRWQGAWATGSRLQEIVAARLGRLDPDEMSVMEMLALTGTLPLGLVTSLTRPDAVEALEGRALVTTEMSGRRAEVSIAHPLHAEVLRGGMAPLQQRAIRRNLVDALGATGARRAEDVVRVACWSIESGLDVDPVTLSLGSDAALFGIDRAVAARIDEILPAGAPTVPAGKPVIRQDRELALRLAQAAYDHSGAVADGTALASTLAWIGESRRAEAVLEELAENADAVDDRLRVAIGLGWVRFWCRYDADGAVAVLVDAVARAGTEGDPALVAYAYQELAGVALNTARPVEAVAYAEQAAEALGVELSRSPGAAPAAAALVYLGRCDEAIDLVERALPTAHESGHPLVVASLLFARSGALSSRGDLEEAREVMTWLREVALTVDLLEATANFGVLLGEILLRQGRPASAGRILRDAAGLLAERDVLGYRPWALAGLARSLARTGQQQAAEAALEEAQRIQPIRRHYDIAIHQARIEVHELAGRAQAAEAAARDAAAWARDAGMVRDEVQALDAWVRLAPSAALVDRLAELVDETDSPFAAVVAEHARALVTEDPDALSAAGKRFAEMTAWWLAAEAATSAARLFEQRGQRRAASTAASSAASYADHCEGSRSASSGSSRGPVRLTKREREIAALAAAGASNRMIAADLCLSMRTVENHLHHAFIKLGVTDRASLSSAMALHRSSE